MVPTSAPNTELRPVSDVARATSGGEDIAAACCNVIFFDRIRSVNPDSGREFVIRVACRTRS